MTDESTESPESPYQHAYRILYAHSERIGREDWEYQGSPVPKYKRVRGRQVEQAGSRRFIPTPCHETLIAMMGDGSMTPERALAFLHAPESYAWDVAGRNRDIPLPPQVRAAHSRTAR